MDDQPAERLILRAIDEPVDPGLPMFDAGDAARLYGLTSAVLTR
ncbi:hypothetical protein [Kribbella sancticallisti]